MMITMHDSGQIAVAYSFIGGFVAAVALSLVRALCTAAW